MSLLRTLSSLLRGSTPGGEIRPFACVGTLLLSDVVDVNAREGLSTQELATALNDIIALQIECIRNESGIVIPTGIEVLLAVWKEEIDGSHAERALACSQTILRRLGDLSSNQQAQHSVRIALGTGQMTVTTIGSRFQVVGPALTVAQRLSRLSLPGRLNLLYTSETSRREPAEAVAHIQGSEEGEVPVYQFSG